MSDSRKVIELGQRQRLVVASSERMSEVKSGSVDVAVTSPPYNIGKKYSAKGYGQHNDRLTPDEYFSLLDRVFAEVFRALKDDGLFFVNFGETAGAQGMGEAVVARAVGVGFRRVQTVIWVKSIFGKGHFSPSGRDRRLNNLWENVYILAKTKSYRFDPLAIGTPYADKSNIGRYGNRDLRDPGNVWFVPYTETTGKTVKKGHEAVFPVELPWRCIQLVPQAKLILDPFAGTCSTLAAAKSLGRRGIGYELYPPLEVINKRLAVKFTPPSPFMLPDLDKGITDLFRLLARLQGQGLQGEVSKARKRLGKGAQERLDRLAADNGFDFKAGLD